MAEGGLESSLTGKVGGVPTWGWGVGLAGLFIAFMVYRSHKANPTATSTTADSTVQPQTDQSGQIDPNTGLPYADENSASGFPYAPIADYLGQNPTSSAYPVGLPPQGLPGPVTNQQWARLAADYLIGKGDDPTLVENALGKYTKGSPLTAAEKAIVDLALTTFGSPPEGVLPAPPSSGGGDNPPDDVTVDHFYTVPKKESYSTIAKSQGVFGGNGAALFWYNMIPNKHQSATFSHLFKNYPNAVKGDKIAIPKKGNKINLGGGVGPVTT